MSPHVCKSYQRVQDMASNGYSNAAAASAGKQQHQQQQQQTQQQPQQQQQNHSPPCESANCMCALD